MELNISVSELNILVSESVMYYIYSKALCLWTQDRTNPPNQTYETNKC